MPTIKNYNLKTFIFKSPFLGRLREVIRVKHMSLRTEEAYVRWVAKFCLWTKWRLPETFTGEDAAEFLTHLAVDKKVSASTQNQAFNALLFMFRYVLKKEMGRVDSIRAKATQHVPDFLSREELKMLFEQLSGEWLLLAKLGYGTGMRLMELLRIRIKDCDFANNCIKIRDGKGGKDGIVPMPMSIRSGLKSQIENALRIHSEDLTSGFGEVWLPDALAKKYPNASKDEKWQYVFPSRAICKDPRDGKLRRHHLFETGFQSALKKAGERTGIKKCVHPHILRHSFATHYLENSGNLHLLQQLLRHKSIETTQIYLHCLESRHAVSPLDVF